MSFLASARSTLTQYATFSGRARRSEFWWWFLLTCLVATVASAVDVMVFDTDVISWNLYLGDEPGRPSPLTAIAAIALFVPTLAVTVRRLHDTDRSGWWVLAWLLPLLGVLVLAYFLLGGSTSDNRFGPSPEASTHTSEETDLDV